LHGAGAAAQVARQAGVLGRGDVVDRDPVADGEPGLPGRAPARRLPYTALRGAIYAHPTMAEGLTFLLRNTPTTPAR
jgi:hypothetical protein